MSDNNLVNREKLLSFAKARRYREFEIEGCGKFRIQSMTELERANIPPGDELKSSLDMIQKCLVDSDGNRIFSETDKEEIKQLDCLITNRLISEIQDHCVIRMDVEVADEHQKKS